MRSSSRGSGAAASISVGIAEDLWAAEVDANQIARSPTIFSSMPSGRCREDHRGSSRERRPPGGNKPGGSCVRVSVTTLEPASPPASFPEFSIPASPPNGPPAFVLATAYTIVSKHGGRVLVESKMAAANVHHRLACCTIGPASAP
jgi:hypothetical protein